MKREIQMNSDLIEKHGLLENHKTKTSEFYLSLRSAKQTVKNISLQQRECCILPLGEIVYFAPYSLVLNLGTTVTTQQTHPNSPTFFGRRLNHVRVKLSFRATTDPLPRPRRQRATSTSAGISTDFNMFLPPL